MRKVSLIITTLLIALSGISQNITIEFDSPIANQVVYQQLDIRVYISSTYELTSVTAKIINKETTLTGLMQSAPYNLFEGSISLQGFTIDSVYTLEITATDYLNNKKISTVQFVNDPPPTLNIIAPTNTGFAPGVLFVKASCKDNTEHNFTMEVKKNYEPVLTKSFSDSVVTNIDVSTWNGQVDILFTITDKWGQSAYEYRSVFIDSSIRLKKIFYTDGRISDFNYNKVLAYNYSVGSKIIDISTGTITKNINNHANSDYDRLTANDKIYSANSTNPVSGNGVYTSSIVTQQGGSGEYRVFNILADTSYYISPYSDLPYPNQFLVDGGNNIAANGVGFFIYSHTVWGVESGRHCIFRYANGHFDTIPVACEPYQSVYLNLAPLTDGYNVVYLKGTYSNDYSIYLNDGQNNIELSNFPEQNVITAGAPAPYNSYQANNKWVAYQKMGTSGQHQIWLRDSLGNSRQVTFFGSSSNIIWLAPNGDIMYYNYLNRYLYKASTQETISISNNFGKVYHRNGDWYVTYGGYLFKITLQSAYIKNYYTAADGNWSVPATWLGGKIPEQGANVFIYNKVVADIDATCNNLTVENSATLNVNNGINITVLN